MHQLILMYQKQIMYRYLQWTRPIQMVEESNVEVNDLYLPAKHHTIRLNIF